MPGGSSHTEPEVLGGVGSVLRLFVRAFLKQNPLLGPWSDLLKTYVHHTGDIPVRSGNLLAKRPTVACFGTSGAVPLTRNKDATD